MAAQCWREPMLLQKMLPEAGEGNDKKAEIAVVIEVAVVETTPVSTTTTSL